MNHLSRVLELPQVAGRNASLGIAHSLIKTRASDQYIVSYPRSGSTWLRTILAGIMDPIRGFEPEVFNWILPGVSGRRVSRIWKLRDPRIIHSHTTFRRGLPRVVYVVRDGRDVVISFYHYTVTRAGLRVPFSEWFNLYCKRWYGPRWHDNVESWLTDGRKQLGKNLLVVKFEELKASPMAHVQEITDFLGLPANLGAVSDALEMASLEQAREREKREAGPIANPDASFYRGGRSGQWQDYMDEPIYRKFMQISGRAFHLAGYADYAE
jgi:hypothetical protein